MKAGIFIIFPKRLSPDLLILVPRILDLTNWLTADWPDYIINTMYDLDFKTFCRIIH